MDDKRLERIENKIDKIVEHVGRIDTTIAAQHISLETHIKRSDNLEAIVLPLKEESNERKGAGKLLKLVALLCAIAEAVRLFMVHK